MFRLPILGPSICPSECLEGKFVIQQPTVFLSTRDLQDAKL